MYSDVSLTVTRDRIMSFVCSNKKKQRLKDGRKKISDIKKESTNNWKGGKKKHERKKKNELKKKKV